jgi:iron complex outermembrane receptor protein
MTRLTGRRKSLLLAMLAAEVATSIFNTINDKHQEYSLGEMIGSRVMGWETVRY